MSKWTYERTLSVGAISAAAVGCAFVWYFDPTEVHFFPVCPLYSLTGLACPGCGLTRAYHALFHGDISTALHFNLLIPVWTAIFGYIGLSLVLLAVRGKGLPMWPTMPKFLWTFMIVLLTFGVVRNIPAYPFSLLFP